MIPAEFDYVVPESIDAALGALRDGGEDAKLLAGGHSLLPLMKLRLAAPTLLVDLRRIGELTGIERDNGTARLGAMTTHHQVATGDLGLASMVAATIADQQVRNRGTLGGSLAHGDPASDMPAVLLATEGSVSVTNGSALARHRGRRPVPGLPDDRDQRGRDRHDGEPPGHGRLRVRLPEVQPPPRGLGDGRRLGAGQEGGRRLVRGRAHRPHPHGQRAAAGDRGRGRRCAAGALDAASIAAAAEQAAEGTSPPADLNATADYKRHLARVLCRRALEEAAA